MHTHRPQVRVDLQLAPQSKQSLLRPLLRGGIVPARTTDGAKQNGVGRSAKLDRLGRKRSASYIERAAADQAFTQLDLVIPPRGDRADHADAFGYYFRSDSIARQQGDRQRVHTRLECVDS